MTAAAEPHQDDLVEALTPASFSEAASEYGPEQEDRQTPVRWQIKTDQEADWALRKLAAARARSQQAQDQRDTLVEQADAWLAQAKREPERTAAFFEWQLTRYLQERRQRDLDEGARKPVTSISLPAGRITSRAASGRFEVTDAEAFVAWAITEAPQLLKVAPQGQRALAAGLAAALVHDETDDVDVPMVLDKASGVQAPGVVWVEATEDERTFSANTTGI